MMPDIENTSHAELIAEIADLKKQLNVVHTSEQHFLGSVQHALEEVKRGKNARLDPEYYSDNLKELTFAVNAALEQGEKAIFYQSILDSLSIPLSVTDLNGNWTFINKRIENVLNLHREDVLGMPCSSWGSDVCNTKRCGIKALKRGETESRFQQNQKHYKALVSYVRDPNDDVIGHLETIINVTELVWATMYMKSAATALVSNLDEAANGNFALDCPLPALHSGNNIISILSMEHDLFYDIFEKVEKVTNAIREIFSDVKEVTIAMHEGRFDHRSDMSKYKDKGEFELIAQEMNYVLDFIFKPVHDIIRVCGRYATGDFTARTNPDWVAVGEWSELKSSLDKIGIDVSHQLQTITEQMDELSLLTEHAGESIQMGMKGTQQMLEMAELIGKSSSDVSQHISQIVKVVEDLNFSVGETATRSQQVSSDASQANEYAVVGMEQTQKSGLVMEGIADSAQVLEVMIKDINMQMAEIGKIVQLISDISNQTNLLALNAAIEAARAGDAGRGFAVVASEVKALAQDSRRSAESITDMISSLQEKTIKADQATSHASNVVQQGKTAVDENLSMLDKIVTSVSDINQNSVDVAALAERQAGAVQEVTISIATVADQINRSTKRVDQIATTAQETGTIITELGEIFDEIHSTTEEINGKIAKFQFTGNKMI